MMSKDEDELILELIIAEERRKNNQSINNISNEIQENKEQNQINNIKKTEKKSGVEKEKTPERVTYNKNNLDENDEVRFIEERNVTLESGVWNKPASEDILDDIQDMPIQDSGILENFLVVSEGSEFELTVEIDDYDIIQDTFSYIKKYSNELTKLSAYKSIDNEFIVNVSDYQFDNRLNVKIKPLKDSINFKLIRVEIEPK